jgi:DNA-binding PadR family transcriptional regulator
MRIKGNAHKHRGPHPERGFVQFLLLLLLNENPMHGYQLAEELQSRGYVREGRFKTGSLYTILNRMENKGSLKSTKQESDAGRPRRVYCITEEGKTHLKKGLQYMLHRKRFLDEMQEYYNRHFPDNDINGEKENAKT